MISSAILDADRVPKFACDAVAGGLCPGPRVMDPLPDLGDAGRAARASMSTSVSDLRAPIDFAVVDVVAGWGSPR